MVGEIFKNDLVVKEFATFCDEMEKIYEKCKENNDGKVRYKMNEMLYQ